ncbi:caldesmon-like [Littorina saxatilis]|uniref:caldesmon-like n=1 Tax=Littorina saxatilis TaxID=31220 RepID=UPI0038B5FB1B
MLDFISETNEKLHKHVETTHTLVIITFLIIIIIVAAAAIIYVTLAYKKNWLPFRKDAVKSTKDEENANMLDKGDSGVSGTQAVRYNPSVQESTKEPLIDNSRIAPSAPQVEFKPLPPKEVIETRDSQSGASTIMKEDTAEEKKIETKKEREKREKAEKKKKEDEEERQKKERKAEMERRLKNAASKDKKHIKDDFAAEEKRLKQKKKDEDKARKKSEKGKK